MKVLHAYAINSLNPITSNSSLEVFIKKANTLIDGTGRDSVSLQAHLLSGFLSEVTKYDREFRLADSSRADCYYYSQPFVEVLYNQPSKEFFALVRNIQNTNDAALQDAFIESIRRSDLSRLGITSWNTAIQTNTLNTVKELQEYATSYLQGTSKYTHALQVADDLVFKINKGPVKCRNHKEGEIEDVVSPGQKINNLLFKADLLITIHQADHIFEKHRGWKIFTTNLLIALCYPIYLVAGTLKYMLTGRFLLFNTNTNTTNQIKAIHEAANFHTDLTPPTMAR